MADSIDERRAFDDARRAAREARDPAARLDAVADVLRLAQTCFWLRRDKGARHAAFSTAEALAREVEAPAAVRLLGEAYVALAQYHSFDHDEPDVLAWWRHAEGLAADLHARSPGAETALLLARIRADLAGVFDRLHSEDEADLAEPLRDALRDAPPARELAARALASIREAAASADPAALASLFDLALGRGQIGEARDEALALALALGEGRAGVEWARREATARYHLAGPAEGSGPQLSQDLAPPPGRLEHLQKARALLLGAVAASPSAAEAAWLGVVEARLGKALVEADDAPRAAALIRSALRWSEAAGGAHELKYELPSEIDAACLSLGAALDAKGDRDGADEFLCRGHHVDDVARFYRKPRGGVAEIVRGWHWAPPDSVLAWSHGAVREPAAFDDRGGLVSAGPACERIFGPARDYACSCGRYGKGDEGVVCERCGVEVISSSMRRYRTGHVTLAAPVLHPLYGASHPSPLGALLGLTREALRDVVRCRNAFLIVDGGEGPWRLGELWRGEEPPDAASPTSPRFATGVEAVAEVLRSIDLEALANDGPARGLAAKATEKRALVAQALLERQWRPEELFVLRVLPVLPPDFWPHEFGREQGRKLAEGWYASLGEVVRSNAALEGLSGADPRDAAWAGAASNLDEAVTALFEFCRRVWPAGEGP